MLLNILFQKFVTNIKNIGKFLPQYRLCQCFQSHHFRDSDAKSRDNMQETLVIFCWVSIGSHSISYEYPT